MSRRLFIVLITSLASLATSGVLAQDKTRNPQMGGRLSRFQDESRAIPSAESLIYKRAHERAEQRAARLEAYRWMGYAPTRPTIPYTRYANDLNPPLYQPWIVGYYHHW
jgi:hypothetical protein